MNGGGWIKLWRSIEHNEELRHPVRFALFVRCINRAARAPKRLIYRGKHVILQRGQLCISVRDLAKVVGCSKKEIETALKHLKMATMLETDAETGLLRITICNYEKYQADGDTAETVSEPVSAPVRGQSGDSRGTQNKKDKKGENMEKVETLSPLPPLGGDVDQAEVQRIGDGAMPRRRRPRTPKAELDLTGFDEFWSVYPRRDGKKAAAEAWNKALKQTDPCPIIEGAKGYAEYCKRKSIENGYIALPSTWLNKERWNDESIKRRPVSKAGGYAWFAENL